MNENNVSELPSETIKLITSSQIITSVSTAVKELVENSIDAGANFIQVRLENYGLDLIEVKDDGSGVSYDNVQRMFLPGYTSKIKKFEDLEKLISYGFRGEALSALCKVGKVSITTKTNSDTLAMIYDIDNSGVPLSSKPSHLNKGTIISVFNLFSNLPVRRLYLLSKKKLSEELKKTESVVQMLALIHPNLNVSIIHNKCPIWKKNSVKGIKQSFMQIIGLKTIAKMDHLNKTYNSVTIDFIIPKKNLTEVENIFSSNPQSIFVYVNSRPVLCKSLSQVVQENIFHHYRNENISLKYAISLLAVEVPPQLVDVNLEPNKTKVLLKNELELMQLINSTLSNYYGNEDFLCSGLKNANMKQLEENEKHQAKRPRLDNKDIDFAVGEKRSEEFREKNKDWVLEIINADCEVSSKINEEEMSISKTSQLPVNSSKLCSQINQENCILATDEEVFQLTALINDNYGSLISSTNNKINETRLLERKDIHNQNSEKKILPEWPSRSEITINSNQMEAAKLENRMESSQLNSSNVDFENKCSEEKEKLDAEIEMDAIKWSTEIMEAMEEEKKECLAEENSKVEDDYVAQFDLSMQSVSSQMGKKEMRGFTKFARLMRPKITQEFPNMIFTQVAKILAERWKALSPDEMKSYSKMAEVVDDYRKVYRESKENSKTPEKPVKPISKNGNVKTILDRLKLKSKQKRPPRREVSMSVSLDQIKSAQLNSSESKQSENDFELLGQLTPSCNWLYKKGLEIGHLRHQGLQELINFRKMLSNHCIPRKPLDCPILINEEILGSDLWNLLNAFDSEYDLKSSKYLINADAICKNGFLIETHKEDGILIEAKIIEVAQSIPFFGISDLKEILNNYQKTQEAGGLDSWRTSSLYNYLMNEAIRLAQEFVQPDREEMERMLNIYNMCLKHLPPTCPHSKDIFVPIYYIQEESLSGC